MDAHNGANWQYGWTIVQGSYEWVTNFKDRGTNQQSGMSAAKCALFFVIVWLVWCHMTVMCAAIQRLIGQARLPFDQWWTMLQQTSNHVLANKMLYSPWAESLTQGSIQWLCDWLRCLYNNKCSSSAINGQWNEYIIHRWSLFLYPIYPSYRQIDPPNPAKQTKLQITGWHVHVFNIIYIGDFCLIISASNYCIFSTFLEFASRQLKYFLNGTNVGYSFHFTVAKSKSKQTDSVDHWTQSITCHLTKPNVTKPNSWVNSPNPYLHLPWWIHNTDDCHCCAYQLSYTYRDTQRVDPGLVIDAVALGFTTFMLQYIVHAHHHYHGTIFCPQNECKVLQLACLYACLLAYLKNHMSKMHTILCACHLKPWLDLPHLTTMQYG